VTGRPLQRPVLLVCAANICRSPAAAALLQAELGERSPRPEIRSAGLTARGDRPACDLALSLVGHFAPRRYAFEGDERVGATHLSRRLAAEHLVGDPLVVVMEQWQADELRGRGTGVEVRLLDPAGDIPDPHAIGYQAHAWVFDRLRSAVRALAAELT